MPDEKVKVLSVDDSMQLYDPDCPDFPLDRTWGELLEERGDYNPSEPFEEQLDILQSYDVETPDDLLNYVDHERLVELVETPIDTAYALFSEFEDDHRVEGVIRIGSMMNYTSQWLAVEVLDDGLEFYRMLKRIGLHESIHLSHWREAPPSDLCYLESTAAKNYLSSHVFEGVAQKMETLQMVSNIEDYILAGNDASDQDRLNFEFAVANLLNGSELASAINKERAS